MISAGKRNRLVTINTITVTQPKGEVTETPTSAGQRWAHRRALTHRETFSDSQRFANADFVFEFRSDSVTRAIDATYELVDGGTTYQVTGAYDPEGRDREILVYATRKDI